MKSDKLENISSKTAVKIGLTEHEFSVYTMLLAQGPLDAKAIAQTMKVLPNAVYRLTSSLLEKKFITETSTHPKQFKALSPALAVDTHVNQKVMELTTEADELIEELSQLETHKNQAHFIASRDALFNQSLEAVRGANKEILIISIGEHIPQEMILEIKNAINREVAVKMIAHQYSDENKEILKAWQKMGWKIRHYPDWGFHLVLVDTAFTFITVNNPEKTDDRVGIQFSSIGLSKALKDYFTTTWKKASEI